MIAAYMNQTKEKSVYRLLNTGWMPSKLHDFDSLKKRMPCACHWQRHEFEEDSDDPQEREDLYIQAPY